MRVGIVAQKGNRRAAALAGEIRDRLLRDDVDVIVDEATASALGVTGRSVETFDEADLVVSIGGDGTFLFAARGAGTTPVVGVNLGEVGFLNAVAPEDAEEAVVSEVAAYRDGEVAVREVPRIAASCDDWESEPAVNEIVVQGRRRGHGGGVEMELRVDGSTYTDGHADGVLVATPTGSTAYNLSERGPLVHPAVDALVVNEMAPDDGMPPLAVDPDATVTVELTAPERAVVVSDGRETHEVEPPVEIEVATADAPVRIAGPTADFFRALGKLA
jgi:NAD+ kinase